MLFNVVVGAFLAISIKFCVQYLDGTMFMDSIHLIGRESSYPGVLKVASLFTGCNIFQGKYAYDVYHATENRTKFINWNQSGYEMKRTLLLDDDVEPRDFSEVFKFIMRNTREVYSAIYGLGQGTFRMNELKVSSAYRSRVTRQSGLASINGETPEGMVSCGVVADLSQQE